MKYNHAIIYKGKFYRAGEDVPVEEKPTEANNTSKTDKDTTTEANNIPETDGNTEKTEVPTKRGKTKA